MATLIKNYGDLDTAVKAKERSDISFLDKNNTPITFSIIFATQYFTSFRNNKPFPHSLLPEAINLGAISGNNSLDPKLIQRDFINTGRLHMSSKEVVIEIIKLYLQHYGFKDNNEVLSQVNSLDLTGVEEVNEKEIREEIEQIELMVNAKSEEEAKILNKIDSIREGGETGLGTLVGGGAFVGTVGIAQAIGITSGILVVPMVIGGVILSIKALALYEKRINSSEYKERKIKQLEEQLEKAGRNPELVRKREEVSKDL